MKRVLSLLFVIPAAAGILALTGCGDGVEPFPPTPTVPPTDTPANTPTRTRTSTSVANTNTPTVAPPTNTPTNVVPTNTPTISGPTDTPTITNTPGEETATPTETPTAEGPTVTPTSEGEVLCGDGVVQGNEECDDGDNYTVTSTCDENPPCCTANCTFEVLPPLEVNFGSTETSMSLITVRSALFDIPLNVTGKAVIHAGQPTGIDGTTGADGFSNFSVGQVPVGSLIADTLASPYDTVLPPIEVPGIACACVRGTAVKSCGGLPLVPGGEVIDCTEDDALCPESEPCKYTHGEGAFASGVVGCDGLDDVDYLLTVNSQLPDGDPEKITFTRSGGLAPGGSAFVYNTTAIGTILGNCEANPGNPDYGPDGIPCTADDPNKGETSTVPQTTGTAVSMITTSTGGLLTCAPEGDPARAVGNPVSCGELPDTTGLGLAQAFASEDVDVVGDIGVCGTFVGVP